MENQANHFAVCLDNSDYPASLEVGKLYRVIPDEDAAAEGYLRVSTRAVRTMPSWQTASISCRCHQP